MLQRIKGLFGKRKKSLALLGMSLIMMMFANGVGASPPSQEITFGSGGFTFSIADIMGSAWNFIGEFNEYVILILALILVATLVGFVIWLMKKLPKFGGGRS